MRSQNQGTSKELLDPRCAKKENQKQGTVRASIVAKCLRTLPGVFSLNLIDQSSCKMGLVVVCVVRILHDDWPIRLGENRFDRVLKHLAAML